MSEVFNRKRPPHEQQTPDQLLQILYQTAFDIEAQVRVITAQRAIDLQAAGDDHDSKHTIITTANTQLQPLLLALMRCMVHIESLQSRMQQSPNNGLDN